MRFLFWTSATLLLVISGCSESHGIVGDAGPGTSDGGDCGAFPARACYYESAHVCGDVFAPMVCTSGSWTCPSGTRSDAECWCYGNAVHDPDCECTPSGWECPPPACPTSPAAEGTACTMEGQSCGSCSDPCEWCNILRCEGGIWTRLEAPPPPPGTCESFDCGPELRCEIGERYCSHVLSDVVGEPDGYSCLSFDPSCAAADCTCFLGFDGCEDDGEGGITITSGGG